MIEWRDIPGYQGYQASSMGGIRSVDRIVFRGDKPWHIKGKTLKPKRNHDGYMRLNVGGKLRFAHQLVLLAFVGESPDGYQCCHNNGIPDDNRLENLRWDSPKANVSDRKTHGTYQYGARNPNAKLSEYQAAYIFLSDKTPSSLSKELGVDTSTICNIRAGQRWGRLTRGLVSI